MLDSGLIRKVNPGTGDVSLFADQPRYYAGMPVLPDSAETSASEFILPHMAVGDGYATEFVVLSGNSTAQGTVTFVSPSGTAAPLPILH